MTSLRGEIFIEDAQLGNKSLYALVGETPDGELRIELHNANPAKRSQVALIRAQPNLKPLPAGR